MTCRRNAGLLASACMHWRHAGADGPTASVSSVSSEPAARTTCNEPPPTDESVPKRYQLNSIIGAQVRRSSSTPQLECVAGGRLIDVSVPDLRPDVKRIGQRRRVVGRFRGKSSLQSYRSGYYRDYREIFFQRTSHQLHSGVEAYGADELRFAAAKLVLRTAGHGPRRHAELVGSTLANAVAGKTGTGFAQCG